MDLTSQKLSALENIPQLIASLGGLHDAALLKLLWRGADHCLEIEIDDLHANFNGLPEYRGPTKATFIFSQVTGLNLTVDLSTEGLMLYDWTFKQSGVPNYASEISFSPGGRVVVECGHIECVSEPQQPTKGQ